MISGLVAIRYDDTELIFITHDLVEQSVAKSGSAGSAIRLW
jgi:hypothetical protein